MAPRGWHHRGRADLGHPAAGQRGWPGPPWAPSPGTGPPAPRQLPAWAPGWSASPCPVGLGCTSTPMVLCTQGSNHLAQGPLGPMWPVGQGIGLVACWAGPHGGGETRPPNHSVQRGVATGPSKARDPEGGAPPPWQGPRLVGGTVSGPGGLLARAHPARSPAEPAAGGTGTKWPSPWAGCQGQSPEGCGSDSSPSRRIRAGQVGQREPGCLASGAHLLEAAAGAPGMPGGPRGPPEGGRAWPQGPVQNSVAQQRTVAG